MITHETQIILNPNGLNLKKLIEIAQRKLERDDEKTLVYSKLLELSATRAHDYQTQRRNASLLHRLLL